jgi:hypothetical protein
VFTNSTVSCFPTSIVCLFNVFCDSSSGSCIRYSTNSYTPNDKLSYLDKSGKSEECAFKSENKIEQIEWHQRQEVILKKKKRL